MRSVDVELSAPVPGCPKSLPLGRFDTVCSFEVLDVPPGALALEAASLNPPPVADALARKPNFLESEF